MLLATGFYMAGSKMALHSQVGDDVSRSGVDAALFYVTRLDFSWNGSPNKD